MLLDGSPLYATHRTALPAPSWARHETKCLTRHGATGVAYPRHYRLPPPPNAPVDSSDVARAEPKRTSDNNGTAASDSPSPFGAVALGTAEGIARFYERILDAPATVTDDNEGKRAEISMGFGQELIYQETDGAIPEYDGHHIAIHIHNFSAPHAFLAENDLLFGDNQDENVATIKMRKPKSLALAGKA